MKLDSLAREEWRAPLPLSRDSLSLHVAKVALDRGFIVAAHVFNTRTGVRLVRCDARGRVRWSAAIGPDSLQVTIKGLAETQDGGFLLACRTNFGLAGSILVRLDAAGKELWRIPLPSPDVQDIMAIRSGDFLLKYSHGLSKIDSLGNAYWTKTYPAVIGPLVETPQGGFFGVFTGTKLGPDPTPYPDTRPYPVPVPYIGLAELSAEGDTVWQKGFLDKRSTLRWDEIPHVLLLADGSYRLFHLNRSFDPNYGMSTVLNYFLVHPRFRFLDGPLTVAPGESTAVHWELLPNRTRLTTEAVVPGGLDPAPRFPLEDRTYGGSGNQLIRDSAWYRIPVEWPVGVDFKYRGRYGFGGSDSPFTVDLPVKIDYVETRLECRQDILAPGQNLLARASIRNVSKQTHLHDLSFGTRIRKGDGSIYPGTEAPPLDTIPSFSLAPGEMVSRVISVAIPSDLVSGINFLQVDLTRAGGENRRVEGKFIVEPAGP